MRAKPPRPRHRPRGRRGQAAVAAHRRPRQARGAVRRQLPAGRLRAVQPRQRRLSCGSACSRSTSRTRSTGTSPRPGGCRRCSATTSPRCRRSSGSARAGSPGSADAIYQSLNLIYDEQPDYIVVFGADHVYRMDPRQMVEQHIETGAAVTVAGIRVPRAEASEFGVIDADADGKIAAVPGEAGRPAGPAGQPGRVVRVDGQLRLHHRGADRGAAARTPATRTPCTTWAATSSRCWPTDGAARVYDFSRQRRAGRDRARPRLLAGRRDAGRLLRRAHGPGRRCTRSSTSTTGSGRSSPRRRSCRRPSSSRAGSRRSRSCRRGRDHRRRDHRPLGRWSRRA